MIPISPDQKAAPLKITTIRTTPVLAPLQRPMRTASGTIDRFPLVLIDVGTDTGGVGRAYAQVYLPKLLLAVRHEGTAGRNADGALD